MKRFLIPVALVALLAFTGCGTVGKIITPAAVQSGVSSGVRYGVAKYPEALPAVRVATEVICSQANGTNVSPAEIVAAIENSSFERIKTPEAIFITQSMITIYTAAWNSFASDAVAASEAKPYLQAVCNGAIEGMPKPNIFRLPTLAENRWPQLRLK